MLRGILGGFARGRRQTSAATLYLDFLAGLNDPRITFSGGANGTRVNSAGVIVAATTPRFDYDPVTLAARGLLVEEARTNLLLRSEEFDNAAWTKSETTVTANAATAPTGTAVADKLIPSVNNAEHYARQTLTGLSAGYTASYTIYVKAAEYSILRVRVLNTDSPTDGFIATIVSATGVVAAAAFGAGTFTSVTATNAGNGWYRLSVIGTTGPTSTKAIVDAFVINGTNINGSATYAGDGTSGVLIWGAQFEAGSFATSYIPTTSASVTRTADIAVMTGTNFSSWYNQSEGTFVVAASAYNSVNGVSSQPSAYGVSDGTSNNFIEVSRLATSAAVRSRVTTGGASQFNSINSSWPVDVIAKVGTTYKVNDFAAVLSGGTVFTDATGTIPAVDRLQIGGLAGAAIWTGHIRTLQYFPRRLPNTQLQTLTA